MGFFYSHLHNSSKWWRNTSWYFKAIFVTSSASCVHLNQNIVVPLITQDISRVPCYINTSTTWTCLCYMCVKRAKRKPLKKLNIVFFVQGWMPEEHKSTQHGIHQDMLWYVPKAGWGPTEAVTNAKWCLDLSLACTIINHPNHQAGNTVLRPCPELR